MRMDRRILGAGLAALWLLVWATPAFARDSFVDGLNDVRKRGCEGKRGVSTSLRSQRRLDNAARRLMRSGGRLGEVLKSVDYRAMHSSSIQISNVPDEAEAARAFARRSCAQVLDPQNRDVGLARRGTDVYIIIAAPFAAPALEDAAAVRARVLVLANEARARPRRCGGKPFSAAQPLRLSETLNKAAAAHARDMADHSNMAHEGSNGSTPAERVTRVRYKWRVVGENVAAGPTTADEVMQGWLASPHHCENLMDPRFTELGVGFVFDPDSDSGVYWTQVFAVPAP
jgi:uncharacterized protein YkwD